MKPRERLTHHASFRTGIIVLGAMMCLALSPRSARRQAPAVLAATAIGGSSPKSLRPNSVPRSDRFADP